MFSYWPAHMAEQKQGDQLESTYSRSVRIRDVAMRSGQKRGTIGRSGERGSRISVLAARHDNDDDIFYRYFQIIFNGYFQRIYFYWYFLNIYIYIYLFIYIVTVLVVTISLCEFVANQMWHNLESGQYLW